MNYMPRPTVFLSYSHQDEDWKAKISGHLRILVELEVWDDQQIALGEDWFPAIEAALERARIAILVISADFLTSRFILGEEVPRLLKLRQENGLVVIPVIARPCAWETVDWLASIECFPRNGRALALSRKAMVEQALTNLTLQVKKTLIVRDHDPVTLPTKPAHLSKSALRHNPPPVEARDMGEESQSLLDAPVKAAKPPRSGGIPTLVIGLGGVGVQCLQVLKKLFLALPAEERVPASFLAFDFHQSESIDGEDLDEDEFFCMNPHPIRDLVNNQNRSGDGWERLLQWFPDQIRMRSMGTSSLRALGRLGFFLNDQAIEAAIRRKLGQISYAETDRLSGNTRVILISSVAGGTGAGMLIDMAYVAQRQETRPRVFAHLLLPDDDFPDSGGIILKNSYACLKELSVLGDQQVPFDAQYFQIPPVHAPVGGEKPFSRIFLYRFDRARASLRQEIAGSILSQLVPMVQERTLMIESNMIATPTERQAKLGCFNSAIGASVPLSPIGSARERVREALKRSHQDIFEQRTPDSKHETYALVMLPEKTTLSLTERRAFRSFLETSTTQTFSGPSIVHDDAGSMISVYSQDLFHSLEEIRGLDRYFRAYYGDPRKELFHIDKRMVDNEVFREVDDRVLSALVVTCGNPGCAYNITTLPEEERFCPHCGKLIRNRME
jgi:hypothetical protein